MAATVIYSFTLGATAEVQVLGPNVRRKRVEFRVSLSTNTVYIRTDPLGTAVGGVPISGNSGPAIFDAETHGDIVKGPFFVWCAAGSVNLSVVETIY